MKRKKANFEAIFYIPNGKMVKNVWTGQYVEDKDIEIYKDYFVFEYDEATKTSTYKEELLYLLRSLFDQEGFTHITIWIDGIVKNVFKISRVDKGYHDNWIDVIEEIENSNSPIYN